MGASKGSLQASTGGRTNNPASFLLPALLSSSADCRLRRYRLNSPKAIRKMRGGDNFARDAGGVVCAGQQGTCDEQGAGKRRRRGHPRSGRFGSTQRQGGSARIGRRRDRRRRRSSAAGADGAGERRGHRVPRQRSRSGGAPRPRRGDPAQGRDGRRRPPHRRRDRAPRKRPCHAGRLRRAHPDDRERARRPLLLRPDQGFAARQRHLLRQRARWRPAD